LRQLSQKHQRSIPWIRKQIFEYDPPYHTCHPKAVTVIADATFFGKKRDKFGVLVFKDAINNEILIWKHIETEQIKDYQYLIDQLLERGFTINGMVVDGKRGLFTALDDYPIQMCHFHQKMILQRYLTRNPKLNASKELKKITSRLTSTTQSRFENKLDLWYQKYEIFISEKSINPATGKEQYTHRRLVAAYKSLRRNLPYLFTYKNYPDLNIVNTTNGLDGGVFSQLKKLVKLHQGISRSLKTKLIDDYLVNYNDRL
jgi:hypothetical protein